MTPESLGHYRILEKLSEGGWGTGLAHVYAAIGKRAEAEKILGELQRQSKTGYVSPYMIAVIYSSDLRIDTLRSDPRFQDLLRRIGLPQ